MSSQTPKEANRSLYGWFHLIRQKPPMYLGECSVTRLFLFVTGLEFGVHSCDCLMRDRDNFFFGFNPWVAQRLNHPESTTGWAQMILDRSANEAEALEHFFILLDEFKKETNGEAFSPCSTDNIDPSDATSSSIPLIP